MGQSTISMVIFNSKLLVYQRVSEEDWADCCFWRRGLVKAFCEELGVPPQVRSTSEDLQSWMGGVPSNPGCAGKAGGHVGLFRLGEGCRTGSEWAVRQDHVGLDQSLKDRTSIEHPGLDFSRVPILTSIPMLAHSKELKLESNLCRTAAAFIGCSPNLRIPGVFVGQALDLRNPIHT